MGATPVEQAASLTAQQLADLLAQAIKAAKDPPRENPNFVSDSPYNPKGIEKEPFKRRYFQNGIPIDWMMATPDEVRLLNRLQAGEYHVIEGVPQWRVDIEDSGRAVYLRYPDKNLDQRMSLPSLKAMLREIVEGVSVE